MGEISTKNVILTFILCAQAGHGTARPESAGQLLAAAEDYRVPQTGHIVLPYFYMSWWFITLVTLALLVVLYLYIRYRIRHIKRKNELLEAFAAKKTGKLQETIKALKASEKDLRKQMNLQQHLLTAITHDIKSPLRHLVVITRDMKQAAAANESLSQSLEITYTTSYRMFHIVDNLLEYLKVHLHNDRDTEETFGMYELIGEKVNIFSDIAVSRGNEIVVQIPSSLELCTNRQLFSIIIHNLLDNAIKFTQHGRINIRSTCSDARLSIIVEDSGLGMPAEIVQWLRTADDCLAAGSDVPDYPGNGIGLKITLDLLKKLKGNITAKSHAEVGTTVSLHFPAGMIVDLSKSIQAHTDYGEPAGG